MGKVAELRLLLEGHFYRFAWGSKQAFEFEQDKLKEMAKYIIDNWDGNKIPNLLKYGRLIRHKTSLLTNLQDKMDDKAFWQKFVGEK